MKPKIIIADDSQTVQKIVKIHIATLKDDPNFKYELELIECLDESQLIPLVTKHHPEFVILDFNLSKNKTGYDLSKEIKAECNSKILMLFGSFDTIDESLFDAAGVNGHVLMPYDGVKIVPQLKQMLEDRHEENEEVDNDFLEDDNDEDEYISDEIANVEDSAEEADDFSDDFSEELTIDDDWVVEQPSLNEGLEFSTEEVVSKEERNKLEAGMEDWGIDVPCVIGEKTQSLELPPVIESSDEELYPSESDLEYPEIEPRSGSTLSFTSFDDLNDTESEESEFGKEIGLNDTLGTNTPEEVRALEEQISDEVEITSTYQMKDLWGSDEVESFDEDENEIIDSPQSVELPKKVSPSVSVAPAIHLSEDEIKAKINELLEPLVEKIVREKVDSILEKISWEVLPDLAENLIRKELKAITNEVLNSN